MQNIKLYLLLFVLICSVNVSLAQDKTSIRPWQFHSINNIGLLEGQTGSSFQMQTINGVQYRSWFGGVGLGLDFYRFRTIPLFIDLRKEFGKSGNKAFVYADAGTNFAWISDNEKSAYLQNDKFSRGFYTDLGLGYKVAAGKNCHLVISLGYSFKKLTESYDTQVYFYNPIDDNTPYQEKINYSLNRLSIKIGCFF